MVIPRLVRCLALVWSARLSDYPPGCRWLLAPLWTSFVPYLASRSWSPRNCVPTPLLSDLVRVLLLVMVMVTMMPLMVLVLVVVVVVADVGAVAVVVLLMLVVMVEVRVVDAVVVVVVADADGAAGAGDVRSRRRSRVVASLEENHTCRTCTGLVVGRRRCLVRRHLDVPLGLQ